MPADLIPAAIALVGGLGLGVLVSLGLSRTLRDLSRRLDVAEDDAALARLNRDLTRQAAVRGLRLRVSEGRFGGTRQLVADLQEIEDLLGPTGGDR